MAGLDFLQNPPNWLTALIIMDKVKSVPQITRKNELKGFKINVFGFVVSVG
jgi:hypothetical protein